MPIALLVALAVSLVIHALALFVPDIDLSSLLYTPPLRAEIVVVPPPAAKPSPAAAFALPPSKPAQKAPRPQPAPTPPASPAAAAPLLGAAGNATVPPPAPTAAASSPPAAAAPAVAASPAVERQRYQGRIRFLVYKGEQGLEVGQEIHQWEVVDGAYRLTGTLETTGLAAVFKPLRIVKESRGRIDGSGLHPERFVVTRNGQATGERADFDQAGGTVSVAGRAAQPASADAQDLMSFHYQLGLLLPDSRLDFGLTTGKKYANFRFERLADATLTTPAGTFRTRHYRSSDDSTMEVWLAVERSGVPVRIRYTDRSGDVYDEVAAEISLDVVSESTKAP